MHKLTITVAGECGSGKSSIAKHIFETLKLDFDAVLEDDEFIAVDDMKKRLKGIKRTGLKMVIKTKQLPRRPSSWAKGN